MMFTILRPDERAEEMERELHRLEAAARVRWRKFWRRMAVIVILLVAAADVAIVLKIWRVIP